MAFFGKERQRPFNSDEILIPEGEEIADSKEPDKIVMELSFRKASEIFHKILTEDVVVIGADTVVSYNQKVLGKPSDKKDAKDMIGQLQGNTHQVYTGVTLFFRKDGKEDHVTFCEETNVDHTCVIDIAVVVAYGRDFLRSNLRTTFLINSDLFK